VVKFSLCLCAFVAKYRNSQKINQEKDGKNFKGKKVTKHIYQKLKNKVVNLKADGLNPFLEILMVGDEPGSEYYSKSVIKKAKAIGIRAELCKLDKNSSENQVLEKLQQFNNNPEIHGILIQMPLPEQISSDNLIVNIDPKKDVDCLNPINVGKLLLGKATFIPCTPAAILELIKYYKIKTDGAKVTIVGRSNIVGKPLVNLLMGKTEYGNATVTVCHSHTKDLAKITRSADILIVAIGQPLFVNSDMVSKSSLIIDVGINKILDKKSGKTTFVGDVDFENVAPKVVAITPVPGGVGSITTASVLSNVVKAVDYIKKT